MTVEHAQTPGGKHEQAGGVVGTVTDQAKHLAEGGPQLIDLPAQARPGQRPVADAILAAEQVLDEAQQFFADRSSRPRRSTIAWKSRFRWAQHSCRSRTASQLLLTGVFELTKGNQHQAAQLLGIARQTCE